MALSRPFRPLKFVGVLSLSKCVIRRSGVPSPARRNHPSPAAYPALRGCFAPRFGWAFHYRWPLRGRKKKGIQLSVFSCAQLNTPTELGSFIWFLQNQHQRRCLLWRGHDLLNLRVLHLQEHRCPQIAYKVPRQVCGLLW